MRLKFGNKEKRVLFVSLAIIGWLIFARKGMRMTISDKEAKKRFRNYGIRLNTEKRTIQGHQIHYSWTGNRSLPVLLFIHGSPQSWTFFEKYLRDDLLLERYRLVAVDRPGFGQSDFGKALRIPEQAEILASLLDVISHEQPVYIVAHSLGAPIAVAMAAIRPAMIKTIVLAGGALDPSGETAAAWRQFFMIPGISSFVPGALRPANRELYHLADDLYDIQSRFTEVQCPVFLVHAYDDKVVPHAQSEAAAKMFVNSPKVKLVTLPSGGHFFPIKRFYQFRDLLVNGLRTEIAAY